MKLGNILRGSSVRVDPGRQQVYATPARRQSARQSANRRELVVCSYVSSSEARGSSTMEDPVEIVSSERASALHIRHLGGMNRELSTSSAVSEAVLGQAFTVGATSTCVILPSIPMVVISTRTIASSSVTTCVRWLPPPR